MSEDVSREEYLKMSQEEQIAAVNRVIKSDPDLDKQFKSLEERFVNNAINQRSMVPIPNNATQRFEYVKCGNVNCRCFHGAKIHGPYIYAYWKENGKLKKKYIGKSWDTWVNNEMARQSQLTFREMRKGEFISEQIRQGNKLAIDYEKKLKVDKVSIDWAYKVVRGDILRTKKRAIETIAEKHRTSPFVLFWNKGISIGRGFDDQLIAGKFDSYLNSEFR